MLALEAARTMKNQSLGALVRWPGLLEATIPTMRNNKTVNTKRTHFGLQSDGLACLEATTTMKSNYKTINARKKRTGLQCDTLACWKQQHRLKTTNNMAKTLFFHPGTGQPGAPEVRRRASGVAASHVRRAFAARAGTPAPARGRGRVCRAFAEHASTATRAGGAAQGRRRCRRHADRG